MSSVSITAVISFACVAIVGVNAARLGLLYHYQKHRIFLIGAIGRLFQAAFLFVMALQFVVLQQLAGTRSDAAATVDRASISSN